MEKFFLLAISVALLTIKPGPGMLAVISRSLSDGFSRAFALSLGIVTIQMLFFFLTVMSVSIGEAQLDFFAAIMTSFGAAYMFYLGIKGLKNLDRGLWNPDLKKKKLVEYGENYLAGVMITLSNPFVILFYAAIVPQVLNLNDLNLWNALFAAFVIAATNLSILSLECLLAGQVRDVLKERHILRKVNIFTSVCFILIGVFLTFSLLPLMNFTLGFGNR